MCEKGQKVLPIGTPITALSGVKISPADRDNQSGPQGVVPQPQKKNNLPRHIIVGVS